MVIGVLYPATSTEGDENEEDDNENASNSAAAAVASAGARRHSEEQQQTGTRRCYVAQHNLSSQTACMIVREAWIRWREENNSAREKRKESHDNMTTSNKQTPQLTNSY